MNLEIRSLIASAAGLFILLYMIMIGGVLTWGCLEVKKCHC